MAVKLLLSLQDIKGSADEAALTLSNPVLVNLQKECGLMASLRHPNVVQFMGVSAFPPAMITGALRCVVHCGWWGWWGLRLPVGGGWRLGCGPAVADHAVPVAISAGLPPFCTRPVALL